MEFLWVFVAFSLGFAAKQMHLPPLLGYLLAGFVLHALAIEPIPQLETLTDMGIVLLLFTVGLKLQVKNTFKPTILLTSFMHMALFVAISILSFMALGALGIFYFKSMSLETAAIIGFALSFSSTVVCVKVLEEKNEMRTKHGQIVLSILVLQDIAAVVFLSLTSDSLPSIYALGLMALPLLKPILNKILRHSGYGEILTLAGFFMAFLGAWLFEIVGLKPGLGALVFGMLLSAHHKAVPLSKSLLDFKDIFLVGFFLSIGFYALPSVEMLLIATLMTLSLPVKGALFFLLFTRFKFNGRNSFLSAADLTNYSEFGLIVIFVCIQKEMIPEDWIVIVSLSIAISFVISSIFNKKTHSVYTKWKDKIKKFECVKVERLYDSPKDADVLVIGMGRVGSGAYEAAYKESSSCVVGIDYNAERVKKHQKSGRNVIQADVEDPDFWEGVELDKIKVVMLALPSTYDAIETVKLLKVYNYKGRITSIVKFEEDHQKLLDAGIDTVFNFYSEAGVGLAEEAFRHISKG